MCIGQVGEGRKRGQGRRGDRDFSPLPKVKGYVLIISKSPLPPTPPGDFQGWDPWACHVYLLIGQLSKQWIQSSNEKEKKKILGPFQWPKFIKVFWVFPNLLSVSFKQMRWNWRGSKDWTEELSLRPKQSKKGSLPEYLNGINENVSPCFPLQS